MATQPTISILADAAKLGIRLDVADGRIRYTPRAILDAHPDLKRRIAANREEIFSLLRNVTPCRAPLPIDFCPHCRSRDGFREFLSIARVRDTLGFAWIGEIAALHQDGRAILAAQDAHEPRATHAMVARAGNFQERFLYAHGVFKIVDIKAIVGKNHGGIVAVFASERRGHA